MIRFGIDRRARQRNETQDKSHRRTVRETREKMEGNQSIRKPRKLTRDGVNFTLSSASASCRLLLLLFIDPRRSIALLSASEPLVPLLKRSETDGIVDEDADFGAEHRELVWRYLIEDARRGRADLSDMSLSFLCLSESVKYNEL